MIIEDFYTVINKFHAQRIAALSIANAIDAYHDSADIVTQYLFGLNTPRNYSNPSLPDFDSQFAFYDFFNDLNDSAQNTLYVAIQNLSFPTASFSYDHLEHLLNYQNSIPQYNPAPLGINGIGINEIPFGMLNSSNRIFVLAHVPIDGNVMVFLNGTLMNKGVSNDFVLTGAVIVFNFAPYADDILLVNYSY